MQSHVVAFSALVIPKIVNARRGNKSKFSQDILLLGGQSIWNTRKATRRLTLIQDPSKERVCAIAAPKKNSGNALAWVQRVHEPVDLWDITFCSRIFWGPELSSIKKDCTRSSKFLTHGVYTKNRNFFVFYSYNVWNLFYLLKDLESTMHVFLNRYNVDSWY